MIDLATCRRYVEMAFEGLQTSDLKFSITTRDEPPKPGIAIEVRRGAVLGLLCIWNTGEADIDIMTSDGELRHEWGMTIDEGSLPTEFAKFLNQVDAALSRSRQEAR